jgi:multicomponent Na+:H+ antiporter subunit G
VLVLTGALMCFAAGVGLIRFPDVLSRLPAATKPQIFGLMVITADIAVTHHFRTDILIVDEMGTTPKR